MELQSLERSNTKLRLPLPDQVDIQTQLEFARRGLRRRLRRLVCDAVIAGLLASVALGAAAQTILDGPSNCTTSSHGWAKYTDDVYPAGTVYGAHVLPLTQCTSLLPGESCVGVFAGLLTGGSPTDVFVGPPQNMGGVAGSYFDSFAIDPIDHSHLLYVTRDELIESTDTGQTWHHVNDMSAVHASAGRAPGYYVLRFTPDGLTLIEGNQVSDDSGRNWRTLARYPKLVTQQAVYYEYMAFSDFWRSDDRGASWIPLGMNGYPLNLGNLWVADAADSMLLYALVSGNFGYRLARSRDGGDNWTVLMSVGPTDPIYLNVLSASPDTANLVYLSGGDNGTHKPRLWKSTDAGDTWVPFNGQVASHLAAAGCGPNFSSLQEVLDVHSSEVPLMFNTTGGQIILLDAPGVAPPIFEAAVSRRTHGSAGTYDLGLSLADIHNPSTEPRHGPVQNVVLRFDKTVNGGTALISEGTASVGGVSFSDNEMTVNLTGVADQQYVSIAVSDVTSPDGGSGGSGGVRVGFLMGDVNQNRVVTLADLGFVNAQLAQSVTAANFLRDINANGSITLADFGVTNSNLTKNLPSP